MPQFLVYAPLSQLPWQGTEFSIAPGIEIIRRPQPYPMRGLDDCLTRFDRDQLFYADHWLRIDWSQGEEPSAGELVNIFLLSLWLAKPTKSHVKFWFRVATNVEEETSGIARVLSRFQWISDATGVSARSGWFSSLSCHLECRDATGSAAKSAARSAHSGFALSMSATLRARFQPLSCFSRAMASCTLAKLSQETRRSTP